MRFFKTLLGVILCIFAFAWSITAIAEKQALWLIGTGVCTALAVLLFRKTKKEKAKAAAKPQKPARGRFQHAAGLPIPEGMLCDLSLDESGLIVSSAGNNYTIAFEKITSVSAKTDVEVQKHIVSSAGGALVGAALFGVPGALIGGRAKTKQTATYKTFLVITYNNESGPTYLLFGLTSFGSAAPFIKYYNAHAQNREKETVAL